MHTEFGTRPDLPRAWRWCLILTLAAPLVGAAGCGDDDGPVLLDAGPGDAGPMVVDESCPPLNQRAREQVFSSVIPAGETRWTCDTRYQLLDTLRVDSGDPFDPATLVIEAGTIIETGESGFPAIVVTAAGRLIVEGTEDEPVVIRPQGDSRRRGDWGGIFMMGLAPVNVEGGVGQLDIVENLPGLSGRELSNYGAGTVDQPDEDWNCGNLRYLRLEFPGQIPPENPVREITPALTLAGCGTETTVDFVQIHRPLNRGIEVLGGAARLSHVIVDGPRRRSDQPISAGTDGIYWGEGWRGVGQFIVLQNYDGGIGMVGDNRVDDPNAMPVSDPTFFNVSMFGRGFRTGDLQNGGLLLSGGTRGVFRNMVMTGMRDFTIDLDGSFTGEEAAEGNIVVGSSFFHDAGTRTDAGLPGEEFFRQPDPTPSDGLEESELFTAVPLNNDFGAPDPRFEGNPYEVDNPNFNIVASAAEGGVLPPTDDELPEIKQGFFDLTADYRGALDPTEDDWTAEWTNFDPQ